MILKSITGVFGGVALLLLLALTVLTEAQDAADGPAGFETRDGTLRVEPATGTAVAIPVSNKVFIGSIESNGEEGRLVVREGSMALFHDLESQETYALVPLALKGVDIEEEFEIALFRIDRFGTGLDHPVLLDRKQAHLKAPTFFDVPTLYSATFERTTTREFNDDLIVGLKPQKNPTPMEAAMLAEYIKGDSQCCAVCGTLVVCACQVTLDCDSCCSEACCGGAAGANGKPRQEH